MTLKNWKFSNKKVKKCFKKGFSSEIPFRFNNETFDILGERACGSSVELLMCPFGLFTAVEIRMIPGSKNYLAIASDGAECELEN